MTAPDVSSRADWDRVVSVHEQCVAIAEDESGQLPSVLPGFLAEVLARVSVNYFGDEDSLVLDGLSVMAPSDTPDDASRLVQAYKDKRFLRLPEYSYAPSAGRRRRPTPFEALIETARRLRDLNSFEDQLKGVTIGAVLGGSASYGRFFNVKGAVPAGENASDIDLLIVLEDFNKLGRLSAAIERIPGSGSDSLAYLDERINEFFSLDVPKANPDVVFSAKIEMWGDSADPLFHGADIDGNYTASLHITDESVFRKIVLADQPRAASQDIGSKMRVADFRETEPARTDHQRSFNGRNLRLELGSEKCGESFLRFSHIFFIDEESRYYPGMFQNLILPSFDVRWGTTRMRRALESFRWKMVERLRYERRQRPHEFMRLSLAHTRSEVFAPHIIRSVDESTLVS